MNNKAVIMFLVLPGLVAILAIGVAVTGKLIPFFLYRTEIYRT